MTRIGPLVAPVGTVAVICVAESTVNCASVLLNLTEVAPVKPSPVIVTCVPTPPEVGLKPLMNSEPPPPPELMVKLALDISKKMLPAASTFTLAVVVGLLGTVIFCEPSLGVPEARVMGKVSPPSVDSSMLTLAALIGDAVVLATFQLTVCCVPVLQVTFVLGEVTVKGPAVETTLTSAVSLLVRPPPARLSRTVTRKLRVRVVVGSDSPSDEVLFSMSESFGKVRDGLLTGSKDRKMGRLPSSVLGGEALPRLYCSQQ